MKELALNVPGPSGTSIALKPIAGMPAEGLPTLQKIIQLGVIYLFVSAVLLTLFFIIWGGIQWASSGGDAKAIDAARKRISYAVIGLIITFLAFFIINIISGFFGVKLLDLASPKNSGGTGGSGQITKAPTSTPTSTPSPTPDPCKKNKPTLAIPTNTDHLGAGGEASYAVKITNKDSKECGSRDFTLSMTIPDKWTGSLGESTVNINPGYTKTVHVKVKSPANTQPGTYSGSVILSPSGLSAEFKYIIQ